MKFSIITAVHNSKDTIEDCLSSVALQTYGNVEHIIIDGGSTDGTLEIIKNEKLKKPAPHLFRGQNLKVVSEPDSGIYDALNKGIKLATGDVIGLLHADDVYHDENVLAKVAQKFEHENTDSVYGDLVYVDKQNLNKVIRYWKAGIFTENSLLKGWMPPHPAFFVKKQIYDKYGLFDTNLKIAADYDMILRLLGRHKISTANLPEVLVKMRWGGKSNKSILNVLQKSYEDYQALQKNNFQNAALILLQKNLSKLSQFFKHQDI
jgi:glycosyltransferase